MTQQDVEKLAEQWEPADAELVRIIDIDEGCIERIVKRQSPTFGTQYSHYRYFEIGDNWNVSVDLQDVDADTIICELAERV